MAARQGDTILRHIRGLVDAEITRGQTDAQLLQRFAAKREEAAFAALVRRHGGLVWGVCRHVLLHEQDTEDAFQATFLVLARRAGSIRKTESLGSFLHGVAYRVAMKAKQSARKRQAREREGRAPEPSKVEPSGDLAWRELQAALDEEVQQLPQKIRAAFVLCCLQGKCREEAARELGCKEGTLSSRVARAREQLQKRLARRGVTLSAAMCAGALWNQSTRAAVPWALAGRTVRAVTGAAGGASAAATTLAHGVLTMMGLAKWRLVVLILGLSLMGAGAGLWGHQTEAPLPGEKPKNALVSAVLARKDLYGDVLPPGALARLGTVRQRAPGSHLAVTADGKEIVAVSPELTVRRFDALTGALRATRQLPQAITYNTWLSPRGTFALISTFDLTDRYHLELWNLAEGKRVQKLALVPSGAAFSPDERRLAVADSSSDMRSHRVIVWDLKTSKSRVLWSEKMDIRQRSFEPVVAFSPDGKRLIACHRDFTIRCWDVEDGKLLWQSENYSPFICFSGDGQAVISPSGFREAASGKMLEGKRPPPKEAVFPLGFSPDGRFLAFQTGQEEAVLWEPGKEKVSFRFPGPLYRRDAVGLFHPHQPPTNFAFTPDGKAFIRRAGALQRWDLVSGKPVYSDTESWGHTEEVTRLLFSPDRRLLISSSKDQIVRLWDLHSGRTVHDFPQGSSYLALTPDGRRLLIVPFNFSKTVLQAIEVATGHPERGFELADRTNFALSSGDMELRVTADGAKIMMLTWKSARQNDESVLTTWDATSGELLVHKRVPWGQDSLITPDGCSVLALNSAAQAVRLLASDTGKTRWQLHSDRTGNPQPPKGCDLALSPDRRLMAARIRFFALDGRTDYDAIRLGHMASGRQLLKLPVAGPAMFTFSADGCLFAVAGVNEIRLWETATGLQAGSIQLPNRASIPPDRAGASALAFSPDGRILATGHADGTIILWDATLRGGVRGGQLSAVEREVLWADLASADAKTAYAAIWRLADDPVPSVLYLKKRLKSVPSPPQDVIQSLLEGLNSNRFTVRKAAEKKLQEMGDRAGTALREALKANPSLERQRRIEALLNVLENSSPLSGEALRGLRAVQALEGIGTPQAQELLEGLSHGVESARLTQAAKEALARLRLP